MHPVDRALAREDRCSVGTEACPELRKTDHKECRIESKVRRRTTEVCAAQHEHNVVFADQDYRFMGSEADLDADVKALSILSEHSDLYEEFAKMGCVASLVSLLAHENTDIAIDAIEIISELTDEDVEAEQKEWDVLVDAMVRTI